MTPMGILRAYWWAITAVVVVALVVGLAYWFRDAIQAWLRKPAPDIGVAAIARQYWYLAPTGVLLSSVGYLFYLSLGLRLPALWVGFGSFLAFCLGTALFVGGPFFVTKRQPQALRHRVFRAYIWLTQKALGRGQIVKRQHAGVELCASVFNPDRGSEHVKLDGEWRDFEDVADRMQYLRSGGAFGLIIEGHTAIIDPVDAALGRVRAEILDAGLEVVDFGQQFGDCVREHAVLPERPPIVDLHHVGHLLGGNADATDAVATEEYETKAWADHQGVPVIDAMVMAGLFSAILFVMWLAFSFAEDGGGSSGGDVTNIVSGTLLPWWWLIRP